VSQQHKTNLDLLEQDIVSGSGIVSSNNRLKKFMVTVGTQTMGGVDIP